MPLSPVKRLRVTTNSPLGRRFCEPIVGTQSSLSFTVEPGEDVVGLPSPTPSPTPPVETAIPTAPRSLDPDLIVTDEEGQRVVRDEVVVRLTDTDDDPESTIRELARVAEAEIVGSVLSLGLYQLSLPVADLIALEAARVSLTELPSVMFASHNYVAPAPSQIVPGSLITAETTSNDELYET